MAKGARVKAMVHKNQRKRSTKSQRQMSTKSQRKRTHRKPNPKQNKTSSRIRPRSGYMNSYTDTVAPSAHCRWRGFIRVGTSGSRARNAAKSFVITASRATGCGSRADAVHALTVGGKVRTNRTVKTRAECIHVRADYNSNRVNE